MTRKTSKAEPDRMQSKLGPSQDEIKPQVVEILTRVANPNSLPVGDETKDLTSDHGITDDGKENLAPSLSRLSRDKYGGLTVSRADSKKCKTVGSMITLVFNRANNSRAAVTLLLIGVSLLAGGNTASAESESTDSFYTRFNQWMSSYDVRIRSSVYNKQSFANPAVFQFISPQDDGQEYWAVDTAISANMVKLFPGDMSDRLYLGPSVEYHRQTSTTKPQNNLQIGLDALYQFGYADQFPYAHIIQLVPTYKNDREGNGEGFFGRLEYLPVIPQLATGGYMRGPDWFLYEWQPILGVQTETADKVETTGRHGSAERFKASAELCMYPFGARRSLDRRLQIILGYTYWRAFERSGGYDDFGRDDHLFKVGANIYLDPDRHLAIGVDYTDGANIETGSPDQRILTAAFKLIY
jgi:hypothetical protein